MSPAFLLGVVMINVHFLLMLMAVICLILAALGVVTRINLLAAGMAFWAVAVMVA